MKPFEKDEDAVEVLRIDADAIVANADDVLIALIRRGYLDRRGMLTAILDRVSDQVLEYLRHATHVAKHRWQVPNLHLSSGLADSRLKFNQCPIGRSTAREGLHVHVSFGSLRIGQHVVDELLHPVDSGNRELDIVARLGVEIV